ncbi:site-2 protease family protein [Lysinibacillus sp. NPDC056232]|uniref:site-2 protease family protein n=1 Tax=Lysinibacillus sp. NPDC056232 TaxID=3345756 RepID=UPI0035DE53BC
MSELVDKNFHLNKMVEIITNEDNDIFVIQKDYNKHFKINEVTAFLLNKLSQQPLNIEQMVNQLNQQYSEVGKIESKKVESIIDNLFKNGILECEGEKNVPIKKKKGQAILKYEIKPTLLLDVKVKKNTGFLFNSRLKLVTFIICYFLFSLSLYFYTLTTINYSNFSYAAMLRILPIIFIHVIGHEMAHMYVCRKMGGTINKVGVGLLYYFIPVAFVTYKDTYLISKTSQAKIAIAGPLFDLIMLMIVSIVMLITDSFNYLLFPYSMMLFYMQFLNLNILMPSDLYRFLESLSNQYNVRRNSLTYLLTAIHLKKPDENQKVKNRSTKFFYITYSLLSLLYIASLFVSMLLAFKYVF